MSSVTQRNYGIAARGPIQLPVRIETWQDWLDWVAQIEMGGGLVRNSFFKTVFSNPRTYATSTQEGMRVAGVIGDQGAGGVGSGALGAVEGHVLVEVRVIDYPTRTPGVC